MIRFDEKYRGKGRGGTETGASVNSPMPDFDTASPTSRDEAASIVLESRKSFFDLDVVARHPVPELRKADFT
jgi:hypothetical protein